MREESEFVGQVIPTKKRSTKPNFVYRIKLINKNSSLIWKIHGRIVFTIQLNKNILSFFLFLETNIIFLLIFNSLKKSHFKVI